MYLYEICRGENWPTYFVSQLFLSRLHKSNVWIKVVSNQYVGQFSPLHISYKYIYNKHVWVDKTKFDK